MLIIQSSEDISFLHALERRLSADIAIYKGQDCAEFGMQLKRLLVRAIKVEEPSEIVIQRPVIRLK